MTDKLATERHLSLFCRGFQFFQISYIILELRAKFTVRRHILVFFNFFYIDWSYEERERRNERKKKIDERQEKVERSR